jgi:hypothetical protein
VLRFTRGDGAHLAKVMRTFQVLAAQKPHFSKIARSGAPYQRFARHF